MIQVNQLHSGSSVRSTARHMISWRRRATGIENIRNWKNFFQNVGFSGYVGLQTPQYHLLYQISQNPIPIKEFSILV